MRPPKIFAAALLLGACLGRYTPPTGSNSPSTPTPTQGSPSGADPAPTKPDPVDLGTPPPPPPTPLPPAAPPDLGLGAPLTGACALLSDCCDQELDQQSADQCDLALQGATDDVCQSILDEMENDGYCP